MSDPSTPDNLAGRRKRRFQPALDALPLRIAPTIFHPPEPIEAEDTASATVEELEIVKRMREARPEHLISAYFDASGFTDEEVELCLSYLAEVYREKGGIGLKVVGHRTLVPEGAEVIL